MSKGIFIDLHGPSSLADFLPGFRRVKAARPYLITRWRFKLLRAYTRRWEAYARSLARQTARMRAIRKLVPWAAAGALILIAIGIWLVTIQIYSLGSLVVFGTGAGVVLAGLVWAAFSIRPLPPENPLAQHSLLHKHSRLKRQLFPDLTTNWRAGISQRIPLPAEVQAMASQEDVFGLIGEYDLIRELDRVVTSGTVILHSVMPKKKDDMDVVVIGPKGIWYFEVKYKNAHFDYHNGKWAIGKIDRKTNQFVFDEKKEPPSDQWKRMQVEATHHLRSSLGELMAKSPNLGLIQGGIVLAHPKATYDIEKNAPFRLGRVQGWVNEYQKAPELRVMTPTVIYKLTDIFLKPHQALNPHQRTYSMVQRTEQVIREHEKKLQAWVDASGK